MISLIAYAAKAMHEFYFDIIPYFLIISNERSKVPRLGVLVIGMGMSPNKLNMLDRISTLGVNHQLYQLILTMFVFNTFYHTDCP